MRKGIVSHNEGRQRLTETEARVLEAYKANGRNAAKTAEALGVKRGAVYSALRYIRFKTDSEAL